MFLAAIVEGEAGLRGPEGRRGRMLAFGLAAVVAVSSLSFAAGRNIKSPAEVAARTAPPEASLISVPVEMTALSSDVVTRGTVRYGAPRAVTLPASALNKGTRLVTTPAVRGAVLNEGDLALAVSGRPVFVLQGARPAYRDLGPGTSGDDVKQLEEALSRLGFKPGPVDGVYDDRTGAGVASWYRSMGWSPSGPSEEQLQVLNAAKADQYAADLELLSAEEALATAKADLAGAQARGAAARAAAGDAGKAHEKAMARYQADLKDAGEDIVARERVYGDAYPAQQEAQQALDTALAAAKPPSSSTLAALQAEVDKTSRAAEQARLAVVAAEAVEAALTEPDPGTAIADANREAAAADADAARAAAAIPIAERRVGVASGRAGSGAVGDASRKLGVQVPADEVLFFSSFPVRVDDVTLVAGDEVTGPVMTVTNSGLAVEAALSAEDAKLVTAGAQVAIKSPENGVEAKGTVTEMATTPGTNGVDPQRFSLLVAPADAPASLVGASVVLTIQVGSTQGEVLAVPVAALSQAADGTSRVQVQENGKSTRYVTVTPGLAARGLVAVTPVDGSLEPGTLVVVGRGPSRN
jgi:peptidoglycan hydrolase-like protein with peptidoglycan-binding domain